MYYERAFKVPMWSVVDSNSKKKGQIIKWFQHAMAREQEWPAHKYKEKIMEMARKGWVTMNHPYTLDKDLALRGAVELLKSMFHENIAFSLTQPHHHMNTLMTSDKDYEGYMNNLLDKQEDIYLSQIFMINERCFAPKNGKCIMFFSVGDIPGNILRRLTDKIITVGDGPEFTVDVSEVSRASAALDKYFSKED